jgi:NAD(P)-dependent dehydrogenase (short-subunit alcohol dehydrogenase family)
MDAAARQSTTGRPTSNLPLPRVSDLSGLPAVVTGAAHGIGRAIAEAVAHQGARVVGVDTDLLALREVVASFGGGAVEGDLSSDDVSPLADRVVANVGVPTLIINNVGTETPHGFLDLEPPEFDRVLRTNLRGPWFFTKRLVALQLASRTAGRILFISSIHDTHVYGRPHYSASKAAVAMAVRELAHELAPHGIRVNAISPGDIATEEPERDLRDATVPLQRRGLPTDVARMSIVLLSDECSAYVTGVNVLVDGGAALHDIWAESGR